MIKKKNTVMPLRSERSVAILAQGSGALCWLRDPLVLMAVHWLAAQVRILSRRLEQLEKDKVEEKEWEKKEERVRENEEEEENDKKKKHCHAVT
mmetsp:Transcript_7103/g.5653  ORF Transcript_7103/g.5653 Transcript_7103/m.5653 type:complete len:94 (+) Transcript_7103:62-343(+)